MPATILIVDDDAPIRAFVAELLEEEGYHVIGAANGREALTILRDVPVLPQLVLLDLLMPVMDAWSMRAVQRRDARLAELPVVLLSAARDLDQRAAELQVPEYLSKPIRATCLLDVVARYCGKPRIERAELHTHRQR